MERLHLVNEGCETAFHLYGECFVENSTLDKKLCREVLIVQGLEQPQLLLASVRIASVQTFSKINIWGYLNQAVTLCSWKSESSLKKKQNKTKHQPKTSKQQTHKQTKPPNPNFGFVLT